ncbi:MAG: NAD(P)-dependent dehydrogenase (short-subunit alcohol dehydrogenase family) [Saprospiraceae bacterium]|jgi:NAD(P)-dependent dehydrogenase (short-subunit alcohol dehydrogenase family)
MNIVITGASRGIGYSTIKRLAKDKNNKIFVLTRNIKSFLEKVKADEELTNSNIECYHFDLEQFSIETFPDLSLNIDVLINNAGVLINKPFSLLEEEDWLSIFQTNVLGPAKLIRYLLPFMGKNTSATHIVNIGSMGGFQGSSKFPGLSAYSSSKAALANLSECLAEELKDSNIISNCLCLGAVNTDMLRAAFPEYKAPTSSDDMGEFIADFALNGQKYFNGKTIPVSVATP